jgi:hypothetical protein
MSKSCLFLASKYFWYLSCSFWMISCFLICYNLLCLSYKFYMSCSFNFYLSYFSINSCCYCWWKSSRCFLVTSNFCMISFYLLDICLRSSFYRCLSRSDLSALPSWFSKKNYLFSYAYWSNLRWVSISFWTNFNTASFERSFWISLAFRFLFAQVKFYYLKKFTLPSMCYSLKCNEFCNFCFTLSSISS